jgi:HD-GYP domain-containing protein (c-di-GMP phosphodiesterase class II)
MFAEDALPELDVVAHMVTLLIHHEISHFRTLIATVKSALDITKSRDAETGSHISRMSRYARVIALELARTHKLDDQFVENIYLFAPLHDVGKIKIPDGILLKNCGLTEEEFAVMKTHTNAGAELIDMLLTNFGLDVLEHVDQLRNIALYHHEAWDGSGYPEHLAAQQIPLEARIVAVADVFDALTSKRPYKEAWSNEVAFEELKKLAGVRLDRECVEALIKHRSDIETIQSRFLENPLG